MWFNGVGCMFLGASSKFRCLPQRGRENATGRERGREEIRGRDRDEGEGGMKQVAGEQVNGKRDEGKGVETQRTEGRR